MSNTRYLEICSDYRNRNLYPYASQFEVEISQSGTKDKYTALDPISDAAPLFVFQASFNSQYGYLRNNIYGDILIYDNTTPIDISYTSSTNILILKCDPIEPNFNYFKPTDFYNGAVIEIDIGVNNIYRRIFKFEKISDSLAKVTLETPISDSVANGNVFKISNPSDNVNLDNSKIFIPYGSNADNYYINYYLDIYMVSNSDTCYLESLKIIEYDGLTHLATLDGKFTSTINYETIFALRREEPCNIGNLVEISNFGETYNTQTSFLIPITNTTNYMGDFLRIPHFYYDYNISPFTDPTLETGIRKIIKYQQPFYGKVGIGSTSDNIIVTVNSTFNGYSNINGYYNGLFILLNNKIRLINTYTIKQQSNEFILSFKLYTDLGITPSPNDIFIIAGGIVETPFKSTSSPFVHYINGQCYEILCFNRDNVVPFNYTGSTVSQQEEVCYEIELLDIVLPNRTLITGKGSRITFYPYVYVELSNVSSPGAGQRGILYSNNPHANRMLFRCPIDDIPNPIISPFIKIDGDGAVQTIKFKINDNLRFSVRLPNGELLKTDIEEQYSPLPPNPINQISAYFSLKRL